MFHRISHVAYCPRSNEEVFEFVDRIKAHGGDTSPEFCDQYKRDVGRYRDVAICVDHIGWIYDTYWADVCGTVYADVEDMRLFLPYVHELPEDILAMANDVRLWPFGRDPFVNNVLIPARRVIEFSREG